MFSATYLLNDKRNGIPTTKVVSFTPGYLTSGIEHQVPTEQEAEWTTKLLQRR